MEIGSIRENRQVNSTQTNNNIGNQEPRVSLKSCDTVSLSSSQKPKKKTIKDVFNNFFDNITAARPSGLTYMRYGGLKYIDKVEASHHKTRDKFHYMDFPVGTKVMTKYGVKEIKENQVAILDFEGNFYIENIEDILNDTSRIVEDTGSISSFAQQKAKLEEEARLKKQSKIDQELNNAGINYIGRINKDNLELNDNVVIEINGERKELSTILYTMDDYEYKSEILRLFKNGELNDNTILFD